MLLPLWLTDYNIKRRHELLAGTIGAKQEEEASLSASNTLVITATVCMIVFSILEVAFYRLYNRKFHPWEKIINGEIVDYDAPVEEDEGCCGCCTGCSSCMEDGEAEAVA